MQNDVVSHDDWLKARLELMEAEKAFTREREALTRRRMAMPWERVEKDYRFIGPSGPLTLADLFDGHSQLIVYHFMFGPDWQEGCRSCSFWADNFDHIPIHLAHRDVAFTAVSRAQLQRIEAYKARFGWTFPWVQADGSDFNLDYQAAITPEELAAGRGYYNYGIRRVGASDMVGISVFAMDGQGAVYHTYSCYSRGVEMVNGAYHYLDLVPKGRNEVGLDYPQAWVRRRDQY